MANVRLDGLSKAFRGPGGATVQALSGLTLDVADGEFISLLGPSGCGKTTALRIVAGLELPTAGTVHIGGGHANAGGSRPPPPRPREQRRRRVREVAELLEVGHLLERRPRQLSGGQRQRIALARAIIREPAAFL